MWPNKGTLVGGSLVFAGTMLSGCSSSDLSVDEFYAERVEVNCTQAHACRGSFPQHSKMFELTYGATSDACIAMTTPRFEAKSAQVQASVDAGRIRYHADAAQVCLNALAGLTCSQRWAPADSPVPACEETFVGMMRDGRACEIDEDCAGAASFCDARACGEPYELAVDPSVRIPRGPVADCPDAPPQDMTEITAPRRTAADYPDELPDRVR